MGNGSGKFMSGTTPRPNIFGMSSCGIPLPLSYKEQKKKKFNKKISIVLSHVGIHLNMPSQHKATQEVYFPIKHKRDAFLVEETPLKCIYIYNHAKNTVPKMSTK